MQNLYHCVKENPHFSLFVDQTDVNLSDKTVFSNKNWNQSLNGHLVEYIGLSKLSVDIILATLYISLDDHLICILINE